MPIRVAERTTDKYVFFYGGPFSQWYMRDGWSFTAPFYGNRELECVSTEQYMMACKAFFFNDPDAFKKIMGTTNPSLAKSYGRKVKNFNKELWDGGESRNVVFFGNLAKFSSDDKLKNYLLATGDKILVEASPFDDIWGVKLAYDDPRIDDPKNWRGTNWLGEELMNVRRELQK